MKKVTKQTMINAMKYAGLTPIENSWKVDKDCYYDSWGGRTECNFEYQLKSEEGVLLLADKQYACDPDIEIRVFEKWQEEAAQKVCAFLVEKGYDDDNGNVDIVVYQTKQEELIKLIKDTVLYDEDLEYMISYIKEVSKS